MLHVDTTMQASGATEHGVGKHYGGTVKEIQLADLDLYRDGSTITFFLKIFWNTGPSPASSQQVEQSKRNALQSPTTRRAIPQKKKTRPA
jgi:hypothetical protein